MRRPEFIARQSGNPRGWLGRAIARIMSVETIAENRAALGLLDLKPNDRFLEVGCAHGRTLEAAALKVTEGMIVGVDVSPDMVRMARRRSSGGNRPGRIEAYLTDGVHLPFADCSFDKVLSVHTVYFWTQPEATLREVARVMAPSALFVLAFRHNEDPTTALFPQSVYRFYPVFAVREMLSAAGFGHAEEATVDFSGSNLVFLKTQRTARAPS